MVGPLKSTLKASQNGFFKGGETTAFNYWLSFPSSLPHQWEVALRGIKYLGSSVQCFQVLMLQRKALARKVEQYCPHLQCLRIATAWAADNRDGQRGSCENLPKHLLQLHKAFHYSSKARSSPKAFWAQSYCSTYLDSLSLVYCSLSLSPILGSELLQALPCCEHSWSKLELPKCLFNKAFPKLFHDTTCLIPHI